MKKIFTILCALMCLGTTNMFAVSYLYQEPNEQSYSAPFGNSWTTPAFAGPAAQLSFDAAKGGLGAVGDIEISQLVNGEWKSLTSVMPSGNYKKYESFGPFNLDRNATQIRFYSNGSYERYIKNIKVSMLSYSNAPEHNLWEPTAVVGSTDSYGETTMEWSDVAPFTLTLSGEGASQFTCNITNNSSVGNYGTSTISATYKHNMAGVHNAVLTISNGSATYEIALTGTTLKKNQQITWAEDCLSGKLPVGKEVTTPATALSGLAITYTSSNEDVIAINAEGTGITALAAGEATVYAYQAGDGEWNEVLDSITLVVTEKQIQYIHWTDNLTRLKMGDAPVVLTATASILVNAETDETVDAPERTALITYESADNNIVTINGNELIIVGEGETTVTATLPGDDTYEATTLVMPVRVRVPSTTCESYVLSATEEYSVEYSLGWQERIYEPAAFTGPGHILTFEARKQRGEAIGNIQIQQYVNGAWQTIDDANPGTDWREYYYELDPNATKIRFYNGYGSYHRYWKNVLVTQRTYLETTTPAVTVEQSIIGSEITRTIAVQYSNLSAGVTVSNVSDKVILSTSELATECGKHGEEIITLTIRPTEIGTIYDTVTIHDEATGLTLTIPVTVHTQRKTQTIHWEDSIDVVYATDDITLTATAVNAIHYTSSDSTIAYVNEANQLMIQSIGSVTITAHAVESEDYQAAQLSKNITILHAVPVILSLPTVEPVAYGVQLTNDMLVGGEANVVGTFAWNTDLEQELVPDEYNLPIQFIPNDPIFAALDTTVAVTVTKAHQSITWEQDFSDVYVTDTLYLYATALTELYYENTDWDMANLDENQLTFYKAGELRVDAIAKEDDFYYGDTLSVVITVKPEEIESLVTTYPTATSIVYGQLLGESLLEGGVAAVAGEFRWKYDDQEVPAGTHWMLAQFVPEAVDLYAPVVFPVEVLVERAPQTIDWTVGELVTIELGDTLELTATASSELPVSYMLDAEGVVTIEDNYLIGVGVGNVNVTATQDGVYVDDFGDKYANYLAADPVAITITVVPNGVPTSVEDIPSATIKARKFIRNGQLFIIRGEHTYNALGNLIR